MGSYVGAPEPKTIVVVPGDGGGGAATYNLIFNGDFQINQRGGTRTPGVNVYGFDRWRGHVSGLEQVVEQANFRAGDGDYTLSWLGGGTGSLDGGAAAASPITASLIADHDVSVVVPDDATDVKLEPGTAATPFVPRFFQEELLLCQRYFYNIVAAPGGSGESTGAVGFVSMADSDQVRDTSVAHPVPMRDIPSITFSNMFLLGPSLSGNYGSRTPDAIDANNSTLTHRVINWHITSPATDNSTVFERISGAGGHLSMDAEFYA